MSQGFCTTHTPRPELEKLSELRAKTERQVLSIIHSKLELGLNFVALAEQLDSDGIRDYSEQLLRRAEQAVTEVKQLLPVDRRPTTRFRTQLIELQEVLDRLCGNPEAGSPKLRYRVMSCRQLTTPLGSFRRQRRLAISSNLHPHFNSDAGSNFRNPTLSGRIRLKLDKSLRSREAIGLLK
jgi:hypothetical protein